MSQNFSITNPALLPVANSHSVSVCGPVCQATSLNSQSTKSGLTSQMLNFFGNIFNTKDWPARWNCGTWSDFHGWLYISSDLVIWASYFAIPILLIVMLKKRPDIPFPKIIWLFGAFIILCGTSHLVDAVIFWWPAYRLSAIVRFLTAAVSVLTVYTMYKMMPEVFSLKSIGDFKREMDDRKLVEEKLAASEFLLKEAGRIGKIGGWDLDLDTNKASWSPTVYEIHEVPYNYDPNLQDGLDFYIHPGREQLEKAIAETINEGKPYDLQLEIVTAKGRKIWVRTVGEPVYNPQGRLIKLRGIFADINEIKLKELALKESIETQERLNKALVEQIEQVKQKDKTIEKIQEFKFLSDSIPQIIWTANADGNVDYFNKHWMDYTGMGLQDSINWGWEAILHPDDYENCIKVWTNSLVTGEPYEVEYRFKRAADGLYKWHIGRALAMKNKDGEIVKWFGSCTDIDDYKKALELENKVSQYEEFNRIIAHNLRGPASSIEMLLVMIAKAVTEKEKDEWFGMLKQTSNSLNETLNELMKVLEIRSDRNLEFDECNLVDAVNKVEPMLKGQIIAKKAKISTDFKTTLVKFPKIYLESIFYNLISNSLKYSKTDTPPEIKISSDYVDNNIMLTFKDNGLGIDLKRHGKNMFKLNKIFHRGFDSKGVGLFMTKIQVETFGGAISVESEPDVGTQFSILLK